MQKIEYDTLSFKLFFKCLKDEKNIKLLPLDCSTEEKIKAWKLLKAEYKEKYPSPKEKSLISTFKKVLLESIKANRDITLLKYLLTKPENLKSLYQELGISWVEDDQQRIKDLEKSISKSTQKAEMFESQLQELTREIELEAKSQDSDSTIEQINEAIASLTMHGFPINDFESLTCGQYDAYTKLVQKKASANKR